MDALILSPETTALRQDHGAASRHRYEITTRACGLNGYRHARSDTNLADKKLTALLRAAPMHPFAAFNKVETFRSETTNDRNFRALAIETDRWVVVVLDLENHMAGTNA